MKSINPGMYLKITALIFVLGACSLDIEETDSLITEGSSDVFNGVADVDGSLSNIYNSISSQMATQENLYALTEVTSDVLIVPTRGTDWGDNGIWRTLDSHTWGPTHSFITNVWNDKNSAVLDASEVIDPLSNASTKQIAEAKFARAYNMWIVMDCFGQVPYRNPTDGPDVTPTVYTRAEAYEFIVQDLTDAINDLPQGTATSNDKTRPVKSAARLLLAKVKLNAAVYKGSYGANDLQDVISLVDDIEADGYAIEKGYFETFVGPTFTNRDVIWSVVAQVDTKIWSALHYNQWSTDNTGGGWNGFSTYAEFYDKFDGPDDSNAIGSGQEERKGYTHTLASTTAENQGFGYGFQIGQMYGWRNGAATALTNRTGAPLSFTREFPGLVGNNEITGIRPLKYSPVNGAYLSGQVMFRFADAHLMRAEAMFRSGNTSGALTEVNELRALRENTPALTSLDEAALLDERGRELYMECFRRNDMVRFDQFGKGEWEFKDAGDGHTDLFPIPASAILSNPNLVQNPGY